MSLHLVTGYQGKAHIKANDQGLMNAAIFGAGQYVLNLGEKFSASVISNNKIRISSGVAMMQGRQAQIDLGTYEDVEIENGSQGVKRNDLIVLRYEKNTSTGVETLALKVLKGTAVSVDPVDPAYGISDIFAGTGGNDMPLYRVPIDGLTVGSLVPLFEVWPAGSEVFDGRYYTEKEIDTMLLEKVYPVGSIYMSVAPVSPATLFGGKWVQWGAGKVPVGIDTTDNDFLTAEKTGGAKTVTLKESQMPKHDHMGGAHHHQVPAHMHTVWESCLQGGAPTSGTDYMYKIEDIGANSTTVRSGACETLDTAVRTEYTGGNEAHTNLQPYITCYMWKRTA